jgi:threonylcarbamoyladenosine tRNA methylthiotransferase CDKAL1
VRFFVETYGCTMNQGEGQEMQHKLVSLGHSIVPTAEDAEIVIVNTCVVIKATELKIMKRLRELREEGKQLVVTGCMAAVQETEVLGEFQEALIMPPSRYGSFAEMISERFSIGGASVDRIQFPSGPTFILPIAQGCLGHCSYCITRLARGELRSYPVEGLVQLAKKAVDGGAKELLVTAQDTACYGKDAGSNLSELMESLCAIEGDFRIRIGMMNPDSLRGQEGDLARIIGHKKVYKFLHLPVQTGSDRLLKAMGRRYSVIEFEQQVRSIRQAVSRLTLSTDVICGFPGESDRDHRDTLEMLKRIKPNIVNVTRFSSRPGTAAESMGAQVVSRIAKDRSREIAKLRFEIASDINTKLIGECIEVIATEEGKTGTTICRDLAYVPVIIPIQLPLGSKIRTVVTESHPTHLVGRLTD